MRTRKPNLIRILTEGDHSLVVWNDGLIRTFDSHGVADLYDLLTNEPGFLKGSHIADKIVGKGAAALMIYGSVASLITNIISSPALELIRKSDVDLLYGSEVPNIANRQHTGICPVETLCLDCDTAAECVPKIEEFVKLIRN